MKLLRRLNPYARIRALEARLSELEDACRMGVGQRHEGAFWFRLSDGDKPEDVPIGKTVRLILDHLGLYVDASKFTLSKKSK